jgi:Beta/Gamma crystallin
MKDNQHEQLFTELTAEFEAPAFQELDDEVAATCSGGVAYLYQDAGFQGRRLQFFNGETDLRKWAFNDKTSSLIISGNERWRFYRDINFQGPSVTLGRGTYSLARLNQLGIPNDSISSLRRIA